MDDSRPQMTHDELRSIEATTVSLETANRAYGIRRSLGYKLAREGRYPCRVIKAGSAYRVPTVELRRSLGVAELQGASA
ncbi:integrase [Streptomyces tendae]|uniref:hypothetical protein n=1 Tax=Streptomyces tendae TaxID=1932 RepID=UPI0019B95645|nr:hypothetical protein [Streptomyces tendae]GHA63983.1 integrase [Streptomyces tendae]